jgi:hypothetical protein
LKVYSDNPILETLKLKHGKSLLLCARLNYQTNILCQSNYTGRVLLQRCSSRLDLGYVQYVVDHGEQVLSAAVNDSQLLLLIGSGFAFPAQYPGEADSVLHGMLQG